MDEIEKPDEDELHERTCAERADEPKIAARKTEIIRDELADEAQIAARKN